MLDHPPSTDDKELHIGVTESFAVKFSSELVHNQTCALAQSRTSPANKPNKASNMSSNPTDPKQAKSIYDFTVKDIKGEQVSLEKYKGHVCLIVNVASQCGLTKSNYADLNELYEKYAESKGLKILAFPCDQFGHQEPGNSEQICEFASKKNVKFDLFDKVNVNGNDAHPLWVYLKHKQSGVLGGFIKWNFTKFVVDKEGQVVERHGPTTSPKDIKLEKYF